MFSLLLQIGDRVLLGWVPTTGEVIAQDMEPITVLLLHRISRTQDLKVLILVGAFLLLRQLLLCFVRVCAQGHRRGERAGAVDRTERGTV